ncbi:uncharacterized protein LOC124294106 [Neodiprion lecontei]|uniref:Uncharacterized protein LOC124294106 n=1 Tax=Neodiprion lecontei TaxID=441921 RepID=A0ABM3G0Z0_NEOLC|nr:uncharacterized protein LOC124294106 [Neodiprion lecontei]
MKGKFVDHQRTRHAYSNVSMRSLRSIVNHWCTERLCAVIDVEGLKFRKIIALLTSKHGVAAEEQLIVLVELHDYEGTSSAQATDLLFLYAESSQDEIRGNQRSCSRSLGENYDPQSCSLKSTVEFYGIPFAESPGIRTRMTRVSRPRGHDLSAALFTQVNSRQLAFVQSFMFTFRLVAYFATEIAAN